MAKKIVAIFTLCLAFASAVWAETVPEGFVKLAITGTDVNLRPIPQGGGAAVAQANTGDVFIAEQWPITNKGDNSQWYRIVFVVNSDGNVASLPTMDTRFKAVPFPFVSVKYTEVLPVTLKEDTQARTIPNKVNNELGNSLPDVVRTFGSGKVERIFDPEEIEYFGIGNFLSTEVELLELKGLLFEDLDGSYELHGKGITITKPGFVYRGIAIGTHGFGKEEVQRLMAKEWPNTKPSIVTNDDGEYWYYTSEMQYYTIVFDEQGLVKSFYSDFST